MTDAQESNRRHTTWEYMAEAIRKTMISKHGHSDSSSDSAQPHGNFAGLKDDNPGLNLGRVVTLGHDTGLLEQVNKMKMDYIDFRLYSLPSETTAGCFNQGTRLLALKGYVAVEQLKIGDMLKTYLHGYRRIKKMWVGILENSENTQEVDTLYVHKNSKLSLTGGHGVLVDKLSKKEKEKQKEIKFDQSIDGKKIALVCYNSEFEPIGYGTYTYYNFVLENDGFEKRRFGVYAEGVLCETPSEEYFEEVNSRLH